MVEDFGGGEILAQQTSLIVLDEPTAFLDFPSKVETLQLSDRLWLMEQGHLSIGTPRELSQDGSLSRFIERDGIRYDKEKMRIEILI